MFYNAMRFFVAIGFVLSLGIGVAAAQSDDSGTTPPTQSGGTGTASGCGSSGCSGTNGGSGGEGH